MAKKNEQIFWKQDRWNGGEAEDSRIGPRGSGRYLQDVDIQSDSGLLKVSHLVSRHDDAGDFTALIKWMDINPATGKVYCYAGDKIVEENANNYSAYKTIASGDSAAGQGLKHWNGKLYACSDTKLHRTDYSSWTDNYKTGLTSAAWHPMGEIKNLLMIGHGRYVATLDDVDTWTLARLTLPPEYVVRKIFRAGTFSVILATKGSTITGSEEGMLFFWGGTSQNYDDYLPLDGNPHTGIALKNKMIMLAGTEPSIQESLGGMPEIQFTIPKIGDGKTAEIYPGAIDTFRRLVYYGISDGTSTTVQRALRSWGARKKGFDPVSTPEFTPSHGHLTGTDYGITAVKRVGTTIRFAWKTDTEFGIDVVDMTAYQSYGIFRTLAFDNTSPYEKAANKLKVELGAKLAIDEYVTVKISPDPYGDPTFANANSDVVSDTFTYADDGAVSVVDLPLNAVSTPIRSRDIHIELRPGGTGSTRPSIKRYWLDFEEDDDQI